MIDSFNGELTVKFRRDPEVEAAIELWRRDEFRQELTCFLSHR